MFRNARSPTCFVALYVLTLGLESTGDFQIQKVNQKSATMSVAGPMDHVAGAHEKWSIGAGKPFPPPILDLEQYVVEFQGPDDASHPQNWPLSSKLVSFFFFFSLLRNILREGTVYCYT